MAPAMKPSWSAEEPTENTAHPPRFEEVLLADIAEPKLPGVLWVGLKPRWRNSRDASMLDLPLHLETGITTDLGVEAILPGRVIAPRDEATAAGLGDLSVTVKYDFLGARYPNFALAAGVEATFPTGGDGEGFSELTYELAPVALFDARRGSLETHVGCELALPVATRSAGATAAEGHPEMGTNFALHYRLAEGLGLIGEFVSQVDLDEGRHDASLVAGVWLEPIESIEFGLGIEIPVDPRPGEYPGVVNAIWRRF